jgi:hypothetical protein
MPRSINKRAGHRAFDATSQDSRISTMTAPRSTMSTGLGG